LHGYRLLQAEYIAAEATHPGWRGAVRGWYGHWFQSQRNAFMPDLFICDPSMRRCLMVELKVRSKYQPGQRELIEAVLWSEARTLERFIEVLAKWEADQCCVATGTPERIRCVPALVRDLIRVATGALAHVYAGTCPDAVAGRDSRDEHCPACRVLMEAERSASDCGAKRS
jgi:hypothetical protein